VIVHSGFPAEVGYDASCTPDPADRIWSQGTSGINGGWVGSQGIGVGGYVISGSWTQPLCTPTKTTMAIGTHEYMHGFGMNDLYDQGWDDPNPCPNAVCGVGHFDVMGFTYGWNSNGDYPGYLGPYSKIAAKWLTPIDITTSGYYILQPAELSGSVYKISTNFPTGEYLLIENRFGIKWEEDWPARGVLIWHVDENAPMQKNRGWPGMGAEWPAKHYTVSVLQADGLYELEQGINAGNEGDFWAKGMTLGPGPNTWPNTDSIQTGTAVQTGISITITTDPSFIVQIQVSGL
jgi:immune inhibitor A